MRIVVLLISVVLLTVLAGCSGSSSLIRSSSASVRTDVFQETKDAAAPKGFVSLRIRSSLKTHAPGDFFEEDSHGTSDYRLLLNIDGQALLLQGTVQPEERDVPKMLDPEAGQGMRYHFVKNLQLKAGRHKIVVALPGEGVAVEREVTLSEGQGNTLVLVPVYSATDRKTPTGRQVRNFQAGVKTIRVILNQREI